MKSLREMVAGVLAGRGSSSRMEGRRAKANPRGFRPVAEPMEGRAMLSHAGLLPAPAASAAMDTVEVNGQVEVQPDAASQALLSAGPGTR